MTSPIAADPRQRLAWDHPAAQLAQDMPRTSCPYCGAFQAGRDAMAAPAAGSPGAIVTMADADRYAAAKQRLLQPPPRLRGDQ